MADIVLRTGQSIPSTMQTRYRDMGDGTHAQVIYNGASGSMYENEIIVAKSGGDYTTIEAALAVATARTCIRVLPGIYQENNPLVGVANVTVHGCGQNTTRIEALNANQDLFASANFFIVEGLSLASVTGTGWVMDITADHSVVVRNCVTFQCENGFRLNNANADLTLASIFYLSTGGVVIDCAVCNNAGNLVLFGGRVGEGSTVTTVFDCDGANAITTIQNFVSFESTVTTGINADNGARTVLTGVSFVAMFDGAVLGGGSDTRFVASNIFNAQQDSIRITNSGSGTNFTGYALTIEDATRFDLNVLSATAKASGMGALSVDKFNFVNGAQLVGAIIDLKEDDEGLNVVGELHVGLPELGTESVFGEGDSYTRGMMVYTFNPSGAVWTDVSTAARSASGSTFTFPAVAQNNAIYVASSLSGASDVLQHYGIKSSITTAAVPGAGSIVTEYWNGAAWVEINHMCTDANTPYDQHADAIFQRTGSEQTRYESVFLSTWTKNDPVTPAIGTDYYWIRFRVATAVTTVPIFQQFKLHTSRFEVNADGVTEYFGNARYEKDLLVHLAVTQPVSGSAPGNAAVAFSSGTTLTFLRNQFSNNAVDAFGVTIVVPTGIDTSVPATIELGWYADTPNAGDVEITAHAAQLEIGDLWNGTVSEVSSAQVETVGAGTRYVSRLTSFDIDISELIPGEILVLRVQRDATVGNDPPDTLAGNIIFGSVRAFGTFWRP